MPPAGYEPAIPACDQPYTDILDRAASGGLFYACDKLYSCSGGAFSLTVLPPVANHYMRVINSIPAAGERSALP